MVRILFINTVNEDQNFTVPQSVLPTPMTVWCWPVRWQVISFCAQCKQSN